MDTLKVANTYRNIKIKVILKFFGKYKRVGNKRKVQIYILRILYMYELLVLYTDKQK